MHIPACVRNCVYMHEHMHECAWVHTYISLILTRVHSYSFLVVDVSTLSHSYVCTGVQYKFMGFRRILLRRMKPWNSAKIQRILILQICNEG